MKIVMGSDHAGFVLKEELKGVVESLGHDVIDVGTHSTASVDYPDFAEKVGVEILTGRADRGILLCGSGVGASVAANKMPGIRAANCEDYYSAHQGVEHDDMKPFTRLLSVLSRPFDDVQGNEDYAIPGPQLATPYQTFCGT